MNRKTIIFLIITILIMAVIFIHSAMPADVSTVESNRFALLAAQILHIGIDPATILVRKTAHLTEYLVLGLFLALTGTGIDNRKRIVRIQRQTTGVRQRRGGFLKTGLLVWMIGTAYAVSDEVHQFFVPGRSCEVRDMCIDSAGVLIGVLIIFLSCAKKKAVRPAKPQKA